MIKIEGLISKCSDNNWWAYIPAFQMGAIALTQEDAVIDLKMKLQEPNPDFSFTLDCVDGMLWLKTLQYHCVASMIQRPHETPLPPEDCWGDS
jgi:hypothetical protein